MRMPFPYNSNVPLTSVKAQLMGVEVDVYLLQGEEPLPEKEIDTLFLLAKVFPQADDKRKDMLAIALEKIAENHYQEHVKTHPGETVPKSAFKLGLKPLCVTLWLDGSWAMTFTPEPAILGCKHVCASFPMDRPDFTSIIA